MPKAKTLYICSACGYENPKWMGKCPECGEWNTMQEGRSAPEMIAKPQKRIGGTGDNASPIREIQADAQLYQRTGIDELDRVLGGGIVEGALILVGGEPGIGKSTLLLQVSAALARMGKKVLYISGEESKRQIKLRAQRLKADDTDMLLLSENAMDKVREKLEDIRPDFCIIDSVQTMYLPELSSAPGSVSQVRESASLLMRYAKENGCGMILVGHVTKEGALAGPRVLEHMVDAVLYFEGDARHEYRLLRAVKNRFGSVNELGVFEMTGDGMIPVKSASETLLSQRARGASGSCVMCAMEGSRPMLVDIQALAVRSYYNVPRRAVNGMDNSRVILLLAVMEKRAGVRLYDKDVYINVAGGLDLTEPAADLAVCCAVASSVCDRVLPQDTCVVGEVGLAGEVRAIPRLERRVQEALRLGFRHIICPKDSVRALKAPADVEIKGVDTIAQAFAILDILPR
ncbi:MAG: DNA repair protein RadA [Clostridia bacterium]|nr:DNA repair protein RadA [Clostridia bacterium]